MKKPKKKSLVTKKSKGERPAGFFPEREVLEAQVRESMDYITLKRLCEETDFTEEHYAGLYNFIEKKACRFWKYLLLRESGRRDNDPARAITIAEYSRLLSILVENHPKFLEKIFREVARQFPEDFREANPPRPLELTARLDQCNQKDFFSSGPSPTPPWNGPESDGDFAFFSPVTPQEGDENAVTRMRTRGGGTEAEVLPKDLRVCLRILKGPSELSLLEIPAAPAYIGRDPLVTARIRHQTVSRRHAIIFFQNHRFHIKDLDSTNGTILNSQRVTESPLKNGDIIQFGDVVCQFVVEAKNS